MQDVRLCALCCAASFLASGTDTTPTAPTSIEAEQGAHALVIPRGSVTVDGTIGATEWGTALQLPLSVAIAGGRSVPVDLRVFQDRENLYESVHVPRTDVTVVLGIVYDNNGRRRRGRGRRRGRRGRRGRARPARLHHRPAALRRRPTTLAPSISRVAPRRSSSLTPELYYGSVEYPKPACAGAKEAIACHGALSVPLHADCNGGGEIAQCIGIDRLDLSYLYWRELCKLLPLGSC